MRPIQLLVPTALAALLLALVPPRPAASEPAAAGTAQEESSPLATAMEGLQNGMRALRGLSKGTEDEAACLEVLHGMQTSAIAALGLEPQVPEDQEPPPAEALAVWKIEYKRQILKLLDKLYELEAAVVEGRFGELKAGYSALNEIKNDGHYEYQ